MKNRHQIEHDDHDRDNQNPLLQKKNRNKSKSKKNQAEEDKEKSKDKEQNGPIAAKGSSRRDPAAVRCLSAPSLVCKKFVAMHPLTRALQLIL